MAYEESAAQVSQWHLDKRVPIALIIALFAQSGTIIWWAATTDARVDNIETHVSELQTVAADLVRETTAQGREDVAISQQLTATNAALSLLRQDVRETNTILRNLFNNGALHNHNDGGTGP